MLITEINFAAINLAAGVPGFMAVAERPQAALLIVHGLAEYAGRYAALASELAGRGISCFAYDQRGHGAAPGPRTHVARFDHYVEDLLRVATQVRERDQTLPLYLWGHSMGAIVVAAAAAAAATLPVRGAILTSNSLEVFRYRSPNPLHPWLRSLARVAPRLRVPLGLDPRKISSDIAVQQAYGTDPRIPRTASLRLIVEFANACELLRTSARQIRMPCLVLHGEYDAIAPVSGAKQLFDALGSRDKQLNIFAGQLHEVHNESDPVRSRFIDTLVQWVLTRARRR
jgi:alpha-beta hydrolase superfamily lysophospholipase